MVLKEKVAPTGAGRLSRRFSALPEGRGSTMADGPRPGRRAPRSGEATCGGRRRGR